MHRSLACLRMRRLIMCVLADAGLHAIDAHFAALHCLHVHAVSQQPTETNANMNAKVRGVVEGGGSRVDCSCKVGNARQYMGWVGRGAVGVEV